MTDEYRSLFHLAAAAPTLLPVVEQNFPGPDKVASDTLYWAQLTFWATVFVGIPALVFAFVDYLLNMRQFRQPELRVGLQWAAFQNLRFQSLGSIGTDTSVRFNVDLRLLNQGRRAATGCYVTVWLPADLDWFMQSPPWTHDSGPLETRDDFAELPPGIEYQKFELFVAEPVFVSHPVLLPSLAMLSARQKYDFTLYWQVSDESGLHPPKKRGTIHAGIA